MKPFLYAALLVVPCVAAGAQNPDRAVGQRIRALEDRAALKTLVDTFSVLADQKDVPRQMLLFTEDATVTSYSEGTPGTTLKGRKQIGDAFAAYLARFDTVYHMNGQQTVELHGERATGIAYCLVTLIGTENGTRVRNTAGIRYEDTYVRRGGRWLIADRRSDFVWRGREQVAAS